MKASMERLETRSTFRSSGILPPRRRPAAPLNPGEPRRRFPEGGGPLLPWIGQREGDEGAPLAPSLPPPSRERAGWWGPAEAAPRLEEEGERRRRFVAGPAAPLAGSRRGPAFLSAAPPGGQNPPPRLAGGGRSGEGPLALPRGSGNVPAAAHAAGRRGRPLSRLLPPHKRRRRR